MQKINIYLIKVLLQSMSDKAQKIDVDKLKEQLQKPLPDKVKKSIEQHIKNADKPIKK